MVASGSRHNCCCWSDTHGLHCTPASPTLTPHTHCKCPRITRMMRASMQTMAIRNAMRDAGVGMLVALCEEWCIAGRPHSPPGGRSRVALPAELRRPRAAPTHLRAAAIRLNVVIWTNMDPSEGGQITLMPSIFSRHLVVYQQ